MSPATVLEIVARTDPGMIRPHNEDAVFADPARGLAILADGMGGYNAGEVASSMATTLLGDALAAPSDAGQSVRDFLLAQIAEVNAEIFYAAQNQPQFAGMGTTLVVAWLHEKTLTVAHIGDSRLYRSRGNAFEQLTRDHSLLQEQLDSGMISAFEARYSRHKNLVTRALGVSLTVEPEIQDYGVLAGDIYLLCSDGLNDMVDDEEIGLTLRALEGDLGLAADQLVQLANESGGRDNVSVILVGVRGDIPAQAGWWRKLLAG